MQDKFEKACEDVYIKGLKTTAAAVLLTGVISFASTVAMMSGGEDSRAEIRKCSSALKAATTRQQIDDVRQCTQSVTKQHKAFKQRLDTFVYGSWALGGVFAVAGVGASVGAGAVKKRAKQLAPSEQNLFKLES